MAVGPSVNFESNFGMGLGIVGSNFDMGFRLSGSFDNSYYLLLCRFFNFCFPFVICHRNPTSTILFTLRNLLFLARSFA